jgi:hypothetical protein
MFLARRFANQGRISCPAETRIFTRKEPARFTDNFPACGLSQGKGDTNMTTSGIGTQDRGMLTAAPSRIVSRPSTNRVEANEAVTNRVVHGSVADNAEVNNTAQRRVDIKA